VTHFALIPMLTFLCITLHGKLTLVSNLPLPSFIVLHSVIWFSVLSGSMGDINFGKHFAAVFVNIEA
jgi:hypothetical protein